MAATLWRQTGKTDKTGSKQSRITAIPMNIANGGKPAKPGVSKAASRRYYGSKMVRPINSKAASRRQYGRN